MYESAGLAPVREFDRPIDGLVSATQDESRRTVVSDLNCFVVHHPGKVLCLELPPPF